MWATQITTQMSNVQITKQYENATTDKWNVSLIFRWLKVICSLPPPGDFKSSENQATKKWKGVLTLPPWKHKLVNMRWLSLLFPWHAQAGVEGEGFKWLVHLYLGQQFCSGTN